MASNDTAPNFSFLQMPLPASSGESSDSGDETTTATATATATTAASNNATPASSASVLKGKLLVLNGPPASGKGSVAQRLASKFGCVSLAALSPAARPLSSPLSPLFLPPATRDAAAASGTWPGLCGCAHQLPRRTALPALFAVRIESFALAFGCWSLCCRSTVAAAATTSPLPWVASSLPCVVCAPRSTVSC